MRIKFNLALIIILILLSFLPSIVYVIFNQSSITIGLILSILISILIIASRNQINFSIKFISLTAILTFFLFLISFNNIIDNYFKVGFSILLFSVFLSFSYMFYQMIKRMEIEVFYNTIVFFCRFLILCGLLSVFYKINVLGYSQYSKSVLTFYEPSHFALVLIPIVMISSLYVTYYEKIIYIIALIYLAISFPSLILILVSLLLSIIYLNKKTIIIGVVLISIISSFMFLPHIEKISYFLERINFSDNTTNLSVLVYMQGWIDAYSSFIDTHGIGLGFQMAGTNPESWINYRIYELSGMYMNRNDGSFTASKLISEFGFFGVLVSLTYIILFLKAIFKIRGKLKLGENNIYIISDILIISYVVEMFFRSAGYFTFGTLMLLTALIIRFMKNA